MAITPARAEIQEQHIADLRAALARVLPHLSFAAGQVAADDPGRAEQFLAVVDEATEILARTAP